MTDGPPEQIPPADEQDLFLGDLAEDYRVFSDRLYATISGIQDGMTENRVALTASLFEELMFLEEGYSRCDIAFQTALEVLDEEDRPVSLDEADKMNRVVYEVSDSVSNAHYKYHDDERPWSNLETAKNGVLTTRDWIQGMTIESVSVSAGELQLGYVQFL